ncbi:MAG: serine/threonine-protein kinase [Verrucomicrobiota bacterium]|jgi:serine/threonine protein kinase
MKDNPNAAAEPGQASPDRVEAIFHGALQLPAGERAGYISRACGGGGGLRERVESLLKAHEAAGEFLEEPAAASANKTVTLTIPPTERAGDRIGRYKLLQQIGEGGCGVVYMAEQEEPVRRRVALKVIKLGMDTKEVVARFEAERQALALMDHPNIARVLEAGATETGRPYFVMELVRGIKITEYCDQNKLPAVERLKLFVQVCHALQHAHQKGIIHRDIKPSNILVTVNDGVPVPKVIDFGIAKATERRLTEKTVFTAFEQFIGTPAYMSPEQAVLTSLDIDTRTDIYSLGVLLYELLTGQTPFDAGKLLAAGLDKLRQTIREQEPERPSTRLRTMLHADLTETAAHYRTEAPKLIHLLQGDLDWIVMKALEKDRTRRYETASALAADIQRHLNNEPVEARPPSTLYRFQKLVRRNKLAFAAGSAVVVALILGLGVSTVLFIQERTARKRADKAERNEAKLRQQAERGLKLEAEKRERAQMGERIGMAALYLTQDKFPESEREISPVPVSVLTNYVATAFLFNAYGEKRARHGEWGAAATNFSKVVDIVPSDFPGYYALAPLLAQIGDLGGYRVHTERMQRQFAGTADPGIAARLAKDCLFVAPATNDLEAIGKFVDTAVAAGERQAEWTETRFVKGLAEYRREHFAEAAEWLRAIASQSEPWNRNVEIHAVLAMSEFRLGRIEEARATLMDAMKTAERRLDKVSEGLRADWPDWIIAQVLMREAGAVIEAEKQPATQSE